MPVVGSMHELFGEREGHPLEHASFDLARGGEGIDDPPHIVDGDDPLDPYLAECGIHAHLRDLAAERVHLEALGIRPAGARAVDRRIAELLGHVLHVDVDGAVARANPALADFEIAGRDLEDVSGELEQRLANLRRRGANRRHHRRCRLRAAGDRAVDVRRRVPADDAHPVERQPELLGRDDPGRR